MKTKSGDRGSLRHINKPRPHFCVIWHQLNIRSHKDGNGGDDTEVNAPSEQLALCHTLFSGGRVLFVQRSRLRLAKARCLTHSYLHRSWDRIKFSLTTKIENQGRAKVSCYCFLTDWVWVAGSLSKSTLLTSGSLRFLPICVPLERYIHGEGLGSGIILFRLQGGCEGATENLEELEVSSEHTGLGAWTRPSFFLN